MAGISTGPMAGGTGGIGKATAADLAAMGARLVPFTSARQLMALARCPNSFRWAYIDPVTKPPPWNARTTGSLAAPGREVSGW